MSFMAKSLTALGFFEIAAGAAATIVTGESGPAIGGLLLGSLTLTAGTCQSVIEEREQQAAPIPVEPSQG